MDKEKHPIWFNGMTYLPFTSEELRELAEKQFIIARRVQQVELEETVGSTPEIPVGYERIIEFDATKLGMEFGIDFKSRYDLLTGTQKRIEFYPLSGIGYNNTWGNGVHIDLFKPDYDANKYAFKFYLTKPRAGNPNIQNMVDGGPVFEGGYNGFDATGIKGILAKKRFRVCFDTEMSANFWTHFQTVVSKTTSRWVTFWQFKNSYSWTDSIVLGCTWDWTIADKPQYRIHHYGDTRTTNPGNSNLWQNNTLIRGIPIKLGELQHWDMEIVFDPTGVDSYSKVDVDGVNYLESTAVNCFPFTTPGRDYATDFLIRGMYFGGYYGATPYIVHPESITIHYSNFVLDAEVI